MRYGFDLYADEHCEWSSERNSIINVFVVFAACRTAVLFTRKAQAVKKPDTPVKEESSVAAGGLLVSDSNAKMLKKPGRGKRNTNRRSVESGDGTAAAAASATVTTAATATLASLGGAALLPGSSSLDRRRSPSGAAAINGGQDVTSGSFRAIPDSFRVYRAQENRGMSDSEASQLSFTGSTCSSCSGFGDSDDDDDSGSDFG